MKTILDPFTFGDSPAAQNLVKILNTYPVDKRPRINRLIHQYQRLLSEVYMEIDEPSTAKVILRMVRDKAIDSINQHSAEELVRSHARNVICTTYKTHLRAVAP